MFDGTISSSLSNCWLRRSAVGKWRFEVDPFRIDEDTKQQVLTLLHRRLARLIACFLSERLLSWMWSRGRLWILLFLPFVGLALKECRFRFGTISFFFLCRRGIWASDSGFASDSEQDKFF